MKHLLNYEFFEVNGVDIRLSSLLIIGFIFLLTKLVQLIVRKSLYRFGLRRSNDARRFHSIYLIFNYVLWIVATLMMLESVGIRPSFLWASSAALLVGFGLGLQQIFSDITSGLFILFEGTIRVGDILEVDGLVGKIEEISLRNSKLRTREGIVIVIPNHKFVTENVINWSLNAEAVRFKVTVGVAYDTDMEQVRRVLVAIAQDHPDVLTDNTPPMARISAFADSAVMFELLFWTKNVFLVENTRSDLRFAISRRFAQEGIRIPFPQHEVRLLGQHQ